MIGERITGIREKTIMRDMSRITTCSIALNHLLADKAFGIVATGGYKKVDVHEKVLLQISEDLCDPEEPKATADKHGLQIANLATYAGGGIDGRRKACALSGWQVPNPERNAYSCYGF